MKPTLCRLTVLTVLITFLTLPGWAAETIEKTLPASSGGTLELDLESGGDLRISGWDRSEVSVFVQPGGRDQDNVRVEIDDIGSGVRVRSRMIEKRSRNSTSFEFEISVPRHYDLDIDSSGGNVRIEGVEGKIEGGTKGGELELTDLRGQLDLSTMGGRIVLQESDVDGRVSTMGGNVTIRNVVGDVDATTMGGAVRYDNVERRQGPDAKVVRISTMGGRIDVPDAPGGADVATKGGEINIERASGFVKANTMGGEITIREIDGWVDAVTMGGAVRVTMVGDPTQGRRDVNIESRGGPIVLTVPDGLSMSFDIELEVTKRARRDYSIQSDFPVVLSEKTDGTSRIKVGGGRAGSGEHTIRIRTTNGDVEIRRGR